MQENEDLRARVRQLEEAIGMAVEPPLVFGLTKSEAIMSGVLLNNRAPRKETFMTAVFSDRIDDPPEQKIIDVWRPVASASKTSTGSASR